MPPSDEINNSPDRGPFSLGDTPTLTQFVTVEQLTPSKEVFAVGIVDAVHV
jgi:hypothetical protein